VKTTKIKTLNLSNGNEIFNELSRELIPYHKEEVGSWMFVVEGSEKNPRVGLRYPGRKLRFRSELTRPNDRSARWANLMDFEVVPFVNGKTVESQVFTYSNLLEDYNKYKKQSALFWEMLVELYEQNIIAKEPPELPGINPKQFLEMLKWIWIQEDLNYRLSWEDIGSPIRYRLENRTGSVTRKGAGRAKFFGALVLLRNEHFDLALVRKIVPLY